MEIDDQMIDKVAHLARLQIKQEERDGLKKDMNRILQFMDKLNELDTTHVEPFIYMTDVKNVLREDKVRQEITREEGLQNAPNHDGKYFRVAKVIDKA